MYAIQRRPSFLLLFTLLPLIATAASTVQAAERLWSLDGERSLDSSQLSLSNLGDLELREGDSLTVLDPESGRERRAREEAPTLTVGDTPYALTWDGDTLTCTDTRSGEVAWKSSYDASIAGLKKFYAYTPVPDLEMVLLFAGKNGKPIETAAVSLATGEPLWKSKDLFPGEKAPVEHKKPSMHLLQPPISTESGLILFLSEGGPIKIDPATGKVLWRTTQAQKAVFGSGVGGGYFGTPNWYAAGNPPMFVENGILGVASGSALYGYDVESGEKIFATSKIGGFMPHQRYETNIRGIWTTERGWLVYGYGKGDQAKPWIDLVDPSNGDYRFKKPTALLKPTLGDRYLKDLSTQHTLAVGEKAAYVYSGSKIERVSLKSGKTKRLKAPKGVIGQLEVRDEGLLVRGNNWMALLDGKSGEPIYTRRFKAPERGYWDRALDGAIDIGSTYGKQQLFKAFAKATAKKDDFVEKAAAAKAYENQSNAALDERLAALRSEGRVAKVEDDEHAYFFAGDGKAGSTVREIHQVRKADGETVSVTPIDTMALTVDFVVDPSNERYYVNDGQAVFAHAIDDRS